MKDTDQILIGTAWIRAKGKHFATEGVIDQITQKGPRIKVTTKGHNSPYLRLVWAELGNSWQPMNAEAEDAYSKWSQQLALEMAAAEKTIIAATQTPIEREIELEIPKGTALEASVKECHGAWHKSKNGYELVPLSEFSQNRGGPRKGEISAICDSCKEKYAAAPSRKLALKADKIEQIVIAPKIETSDGPYFRWKVTVIQTVEHIVQGKDLLDVAAQAESLGRVIKVEQL